MASPQLRAVIRALERHKRIFDLDRGGLGEKVLDVVADQITRAMDDQVDPDGPPWPPLSAEYAAHKSRHFPGQKMGVLYGYMKSPSQIRGERTITRDEAAATYGTDQETREEAGHFQARRPFYAISAEAERRIAELIEKHHAKSL